MPTNLCLLQVIYSPNFSPPPARLKDVRPARAPFTLNVTWTDGRRAKIDMTGVIHRAAAEVRSAFAKHGGSLGETGSVNFMFDRVGVIHFKADATGLAKSVSPIRLGGRLREVWPG